MKSTVRILIWTVLLVAIFGFIGCGGGSDTTITDRINAFEADLNADNYDNLWTHMHPDSSAYTQRRDANTWTTDFPRSEQPFTISFTVSGSTASGTITSASLYSGDSITFQMKNDPESGGLFGGDTDNWLILSISGAVTVN
jgi:hypothetical protein